MNMREQNERDIARIILAAAADEASQRELEELNELIADQPQVAKFVVDLMSQEAWLNWHTESSRSGEIRNELLEHITHVIESSGNQQSSEAEVLQLLEAGSCAGLVHPKQRQWLTTDSESRSVIARSRYIGVLAASLLVATGLVVGLLISQWKHSIWDRSIEVADAGVSAIESSYVARFVHGTACLWNQETDVPVTSGALRTGESLSLLEGLAELQLDWDSGNAALRIEGPAGLVLTAERGASLSHGRFTADVETSDSEFSLSTPNGLIEVSGDASLGVAISGGNVELHVFKGSAQFVGPWTRSTQRTEPVTVQAGEAIQIAADAEGRKRLHRDSASPSSFASKVSMGSDHLPVTTEYVKEVVAAKPLIYWRFEDADSQRVSNEMGDSFSGQLKGVADRVRQAGNTSLELGAGLSEEALQSFVYCDEPLDGDFTAGYSLEVWFKPSHYHWGSVISFLGDPAQVGWRASHGLLLEIGGPRLSASEIEHPGRLRYLHRNPPGGDFASGTSLFSDAVYELRKWQHIVAVKTATDMRLYNNGDLVAKGDDSTTLAPGMKIMVGQLDREQFYRKFIGQIDELAVYNRPLSEKEIKSHYQLIRPSWNQRRVPGKSKETASLPVLLKLFGSVAWK